MSASPTDRPARPCERDPDPGPADRPTRSGPAGGETVRSVAVLQERRVVRRGRPDQRRPDQLSCVCLSLCWLCGCGLMSSNVLGCYIQGCDFGRPVGVLGTNRLYFFTRVPAETKTPQNETDATRLASARPARIQRVSRSARIGAGRPTDPSRPRPDPPTAGRGGPTDRPSPEPPGPGDAELSI